ncbi:hypothetical protein QM012_001968 [Aureobasidium pullulans]|uniref:Uncharacterized protein n=1 Tax=Aureobasidium pullulans TaxID=5580 RepID=A0ABR0TEE5_AURPU
MLVKLETPANVQQTHQHDSSEKFPVPLDTQMQDLQPTSLEKPNVPAVVQTQTPEKVERLAETQQTPQHNSSDKSEVLLVTQPQTVQPNPPEKPVTSAASETQPPQPTLSEKHEEPAAPPAQALQQNAPEKSEKPAESQQVTQHNLPEKPVEAQVQPDLQHVSS